MYFTKIYLKYIVCVLYLLPIVDIVPGHCQCQEEVCTQGGSCPGWPYLKQEDKYDKTNKENKFIAVTQGKHQIHFAAPQVCLNLVVQSISRHKFSTTAITCLCFD